MRICLITIEQKQGLAFAFQFKRKAVSDCILHSDLSTLNYASYDHVILTGYFPGVIRRELEIPRQISRRELPASIQYKFVHNLPVDPNDVWWEYRIENPRESKSEYKICASSIEKNIFTEQLNFLNQNNIQIDKCILTPLLISGDLFPGIEKYFPPTPENFMAYLQQIKPDEYDKFVLSSKEDISLPVRLAFFAFLAYVQKSGNIDSIVAHENMVPRSIQPVRYRFVRKINLVLMLFAVLFASVVLIERSNRSYAHYEIIERENSDLRNELKELQTKNFHLAGEEKLLKEYQDLKAGYVGLEDVILEITQKVPSHMWVKALRFNNNTLELTIESSKDDINFYNTLKNGKLFELKNLKKNKIRGESFDYTVSLELGKN